MEERNQLPDDTVLFVALTGIFIIAGALTLISQMQRIVRLYTIFMEGRENDRSGRPMRAERATTTVDARTKIQNRRKAEKRKKASLLQRL